MEKGKDKSDHLGPEGPKVPKGTQGSIFNASRTLHLGPNAGPTPVPNFQHHFGARIEAVNFALHI